MSALLVDPALVPAWDGASGAGLLGLAAATAGGRSAAVVVAARPLAEAEAVALAGRLEGLLGGPVELAVLAASPGCAGAEELVRQWVNQAAQGSGRGVAVRVEDAVEGPLRVLVRAVDSSARELALRLASPHEPALPALRALLGRDVTVQDAETA